MSKLKFWIQHHVPECVVLILSLLVAIVATRYSFFHGYVMAYGDAESHLNIAKRVISSPISGFAQLGGVWLPLPHLLLIPFVSFDFLWRTGLAGSIVSGIAFILAALFVYKTTHIITDNRAASAVSLLVFVSNPNVLYMQSTSLTELPLIALLTITIYYFIKYLKKGETIGLLVITAFFGFCTTLTRYDGWFLVLFIAIALIFRHSPWLKIPDPVRKFKIYFNRNKWHHLQGRLIIFSVMAFLGVGLWLLWGYLILGDPLYFAHSEFSAKAQQNILLAAHQLPAYGSLFLSFLYYCVTSIANIGSIIFFVGCAGLIVLLLHRKNDIRYYIVFVSLAIFFFNVLTLYLGQSVIFIPSLNPISVGNNIFNVRYGLMTLPFIALCFGYLYYCCNKYLKATVLLLFVIQLGIFISPTFNVITLDDGLYGISSSIKDVGKISASHWLRDHYDSGYVLEDDYARSISVTDSDVPMKDIVYIGSGKYWKESFDDPGKYVNWIVIKQSDTIWKNLYEVPALRAKLEQSFALVYSSNDRMIFKKINNGESPVDTTLYNRVIIE